jgi:hypothetical protein
MPTEAERHKLQTYLTRPLADLESELELYAPASRGAEDAWQKIAGPLRQRLCVEWDYCHVRQDARWADDLSLGLIVLEVLTSRALNLPFPVDLALVTTIVVKRGLDVFCNCP